MGGGEDAIAKPGEERGLGLAASLFGFDSGAALATVVGVLVEVPVMLSVVAIVMRSKGWYQRA
jgi:ACR3 family arsenite transporter